MYFEGIDDLVPEDVGRHIMSFLDVPTLVQKKAVCRSWQILFTDTIHQKRPTPKPFQTHKELREVIKKYVNYNRADAEEFATTYGWPIGRWDVSTIERLSRLFDGLESFNEYIGSWDVSNANRMFRMFRDARSFNQDISSWNTSNVTIMNKMFQTCLQMPHPSTKILLLGIPRISCVVYVTDMDCIFENAQKTQQTLTRTYLHGIPQMSLERQTL
eukprot:scaffold62347_cov53-Attheya_sp.AAC.3